jgi:hypothetical protein
MQMFDRKVMALSTLYVGLVATKRELTPQIRAALKETSTHLSSDSLHYKKLHDDTDKYESFYTFKFVCFSDRAARQGAFQNKFRDDWKYAEPPSKKQRPVHQNDVQKGSTAFDPFEPVSLKDYRSMVGAWKIGKVMDTAARRKDVYSGGPIDTAEQLTVNVCIEWCDWRKLRRSVNREDIGGYVSGAAMWLASIPGQTKAKDDKTEMVFYVDKDEGRIFQWPTQYTSRGSSQMDPAKDDEAAKSNAPMNMDRDVTDRYYKLNKDVDQQHGDYIQNAKDTFMLIQDDATQRGIRNRIIRYRAEGTQTKLSDSEIDTLFNAISGGSNVFLYNNFENWYLTLDLSDGSPEQNLKFLQALIGADNAKDLAQARTKQEEGRAKTVFARMKYFTATSMLSTVIEITKDTFVNYLSSKPTNDDQKKAQSNVPSTIGDSMENAVNTLVEHDVYMHDETGGTESMSVQKVTSVSSTTATSSVSKSRAYKTSKSKAVAPSAPSAPSIPAAVAAVATGASTAASASSGSNPKPSAKPAAKTVSTASAAPAAPAAPAAQPMQVEPTSTTATQSETSDIFSAIFGESANSGEPEKSPSSGNPKSRVRRPREGR